MRIRLLVLLGPLVLSGCLDLGSSGILGSPAGTYTLDMEAFEVTLTENAKADARELFGASSAELSDEQEQEMTRYLETLEGALLEHVKNISMEITLRPDGTWEGSTDEGGGLETASGTWELQGETMTLVTLMEDGHPLEAPIRQDFTYRMGELLISDEDGFEWVLRRQ